MMCEDKEKYAENIYHQLNKHIEDGHSDGVREWLEEFAPETPGMKRPLRARNPVSLSAELGNTKIFQLLMEHGFQPNSPDDGGPGYRRPRLLPIHLAAMKGHCDLVKQLVGVYNADVNSRDLHIAPLHMAVTDRQTEVVKYLLLHGACPLWLPCSISSCGIRSPLDTAVTIGCWDIVTLMIDSLESLHIASFVATLDLILQTKRQDVGFELYKKYMSITQSSSEILPIFIDHKILHFLLEVRYPPYFDEERLNKELKKNLHKLDNTSLRLRIESGCPLRGRELMQTLKDQRSRSSIIKTLLEYTSHPQSLKYLSIFRIRNCLGLVTPENIGRLPLPGLLRSLLRLQHLQYGRKRSDDNKDSDVSDENDDGEGRLPLCLKPSGEH